MARLVLIGGAPGVGKTTLLHHLPAEFGSCACLDADDLLQGEPAELSPAMGAAWEENVVAVLRERLAEDHAFVFLAWVLADPEKIERILGGLEGRYDSLLVVHLTAGRDALAARARDKLERGLAPGYQAAKAEQIEALPFAKLDTTGLSPEAVARAVRALAGG